MLTGGAGGRAMSLAFEEIFAIRDAFGGVPMPGRTDAWILALAAAAHGIPADSPDLARFTDVYIRHLAAEIQRPGPQKGVMPGVRALLDLLSQRHDVFLALLTGNLEAAAEVKLRYFDLWRYFRCGAFGDGADDRNGLLPKALSRVTACGGPSVSASNTVVVGDTPLDIEVASVGGARSIGVATGGYTMEQLRAAGANVVLQDLGDSAEVLRAMRIAD